MLSPLISQNPTVTSANYVYTSLPQQLVFVFSENVNITSSAITVQNLSTGAVVTPSTFSYNSTSDTATFGFGSTALGNGKYVATLSV